MQISGWDKEYEIRGIPSSSKTSPSQAVVWGYRNVEFLEADGQLPLSVLEVGCGAGRNALYVAAQGAVVKAFDGSEVAIQLAKTKSSGHNPEFFHHDLEDGIPFEEDAFDVVMDIFVYKHQLLSSERRAYRSEISRVLRPGGIFLLSLAHIEDGFYSNCPAIENSDADNPLTVMDETAQIGSVLFSLTDLQKEMEDCFECEMTWDKTSTSGMHGKSYSRKILSGLWRNKK